MPKATLETIQRFFVEEFHQCDHVVESIGEGSAIVRQSVDEKALRPGAPYQAR